MKVSWQNLFELFINAPFLPKITLFLTFHSDEKAQNVEKAERKTPARRDTMDQSKF